jgi:hypothetical protein
MSLDLDRDILPNTRTHAARRTVLEIKEMSEHEPECSEDEFEDLLVFAILDRGDEAFLAWLRDKPGNMTMAMRAIDRCERRRNAGA